MADNSPALLAPVMLPGISADLQGSGLVAQIVEPKNYLDRMEVGGSSSNAVKEGQVGMGCLYAVVDKNPIDLGKTVDGLLVTYTAIAMRFDGAGNPPEVSRDPNSELFIEIQKQAGERDSGCRFGYQFLFWSAARKEFYSFMLASKSARREFTTFRDLTGKAVTLKTELVKTAKHSWFVPKAVACRTPFTSPLPTPDEVKAACEKFVNVSATETAAEGENNQNGR